MLGTHLHRRQQPDGSGIRKLRQQVATPWPPVPSDLAALFAPPPG